MPYGLTLFGDVLLPDRMAEDDLSTGEVESTLVDSIGGVYDYFATQQRLPRKQTVQQKGIYVGELTYLVDEAGNYLVDEAGNNLIAGDADTMLRSQLDPLKAMQGKQDNLWRERLSDDALHWKTARLLKVDHTQTVDDAGIVSEVQCQFETLMAGWRAATLTTVSKAATDGVKIGLDAYNTGDFSTEDAILRVARTSGTITQVRITGAGIDITWTGSIGSGQTLVIDAGAQTVQIGATDQYGGFVLNAGHTLQGWLSLARGHNLLNVTVTGGNATVSVEYYPQSA